LTTEEAGMASERDRLINVDFDDDEDVPSDAASHDDEDDEDDVELHGQFFNRPSS